MNAEQFETAVLELWSRTRVPLTRASVQVLTRVPRGLVEKWLRRMTEAGVLVAREGDDGEPVFEVRGVTRAERGPRTVDEALALEEVRASAALREREGARAVASRAVQRGGRRGQLALTIGVVLGVLLTRSKWVALAGGLLLLGAMAYDELRSRWQALVGDEPRAARAPRAKPRDARAPAALPPASAGRGGEKRDAVDAEFEDS